VSTIKNNTEEVYGFYVEKAIELSKRFKGCKVLKTDCHNESGIFVHSKPIIPRIWDSVDVTALEIDETVINRAKDNIGSDKWNVVQGDIRKLPFKDKEFSLVLDFSTIDHVHYEELDLVVQEYVRVSSAFFIVVWTGKFNRTCGAVPGQYYFNKDYFERKLLPFVKSVDSYALWVHPNNKDDILMVYEGEWK
jgi:hypothetical protein